MRSLRVRLAIALAAISLYVVAPLVVGAAAVRPRIWPCLTNCLCMSGTCTST